MSDKLPHEIYPSPDEETGTASEWATYHLVRACAYAKLMQHVILGDDPVQTSSAILGFIGEFAQAFLMDRVTDEDARELVGILSAGDVADEMTWDLLVQRGIHPDAIARFSTFAESAEKRAAPAAEESATERVARELYRQWREESGGDPADLPEWERLNEEGCDDDEPDLRGEYRRRAASLIAVLRGPSSDAERAVERVLALAEELDEETDSRARVAGATPCCHAAARIRAAVAGD